jgi:hypothetical protein
VTGIHDIVPTDITARDIFACRLDSGGGTRTRVNDQQEATSSSAVIAIDLDPTAGRAEPLPRAMTCVRDPRRYSALAAG